MSKSRSKRVAAPQASGENGNTASKDFSPKIPQRDKIAFDLNIRQRDDMTPKQCELLDLILHRDTRVVFVNGPAGTAKSYTSVLAGLTLLQKRAVSDIAYIRSTVESASKSMGFLPGEAGDKMEPYLRPLRDKLDELLPSGEVDRLVKDKRAEGIPVGFLRGASFNARFILLDEAQNLNAKEMLTVLTRVGRFSKLIVAGDPMQSDINGASAFQRTFDLFNDEESRTNGIHCFSFTRDDIVRSPITRFIVERYERQGQAAVKNEPMFPPK